MPTALANDMFSAVAQMEQVNQLKSLMKKIVDSTSFKDLDSDRREIQDINFGFELIVIGGVWKCW